VVRDIQVRVLACRNQLPTLSGPFAYNLCVGQQFCLNVTSADPDPNDVLTVTVLNNTTGIPVVISGGPNPTASGCWTPTVAGTYTLTLQVRDNACPLNGIQQFTYTFNVRNCSPCDQLTINANFTHAENQLTTTVTNTSTVTPANLGAIFTQIIWGDNSPNSTFLGNYTTPVSHTYAQPGTYNVCLVILAYVGNVCCHDTICMPVTVTNDPCSQISINPSFTHVENVLQTTVTNTSTVTPSNLGAIFTQILWGDNTTSSFVGNHTTPETHTYASAGTYNVCVVILAFVGNECCHDTICETIRISDNPCDFFDARFVAVANIRPACSYTFWDVSTPTSSTQFWDFDDNTSLGTGSPITHQYTASGTYTITLYAQYHPPGFPNLCCYDSYSETYRIDCLRDAPIGGDVKKTSATVGYDTDQDQLLIWPGEGLLSDKPTHAAVYDMTGKLIVEVDFLGTESPRIDFSTYAKGVYFVRISGNDEVQTTRFVKQ
jgi:PKD domain